MGKAKTPTIRTQKDRFDSARFIVYELMMLQRSAKMPKPRDDVFMRSLGFEGLVLHTRVLRDFFYKKLDRLGKLIEPKDDDILAVQYFALDSSWPYSYADMSKYLRDHKTRMDRALAHLSYDRLNYTGKDKAWDDKQIRDDIGGRWFEFLGKLQTLNDPAVPCFLYWARKYEVPIVAPF